MKRITPLKTRKDTKGGRTELRRDLVAWVRVFRGFRGSIIQLEGLAP